MRHDKEGLVKLVPEIEEKLVQLPGVCRVEITGWLIGKNDKRVIDKGPCNSYPLLLTIPADMPFLPTDLLDRLAASIGESGCAMASSGGHSHPVSALWRVSALGQLDDYVSSGTRSLKGFAALVGAVEVEWASDPDDPFFNINSVADLAEAEKRLR